MRERKERRQSDGIKRKVEKIKGERAPMEASRQGVRTLREDSERMVV